MFFSRQAASHLSRSPSTVLVYLTIWFPMIIFVEAWTLTEHWSKHGDMMYQYARCLQDNIRLEQPAIQDIAIYVDVWCSLNGRFQQRMFDPRVDLLSVDWSPFTPVSWLMPLLTELTPWRRKIAELEEQVYLWSNHTDVLFVADFPGEM